jgi:hypothetical protein
MVSWEVEVTGTSPFAMTGVLNLSHPPGRDRDGGEVDKAVPVDGGAEVATFDAEVVGKMLVRLWTMWSPPELKPRMLSRSTT